MVSALKLYRDRNHYEPTYRVYVDGVASGIVTSDQSKRWFCQLAGPDGLDKHLPKGHRTRAQAVRCLLRAAKGGRPIGGVKASA